ncbi:24318_t:CDS:2, partial [Gigaspora margarita]
VLKNKSGKISITTSNEGHIQRQPSVLLYESNNTNKSGSVYKFSLHFKLLVCELFDIYKSSKNIKANFTVSDNFEDELVALNNRLKDNIVNSNKSDLFASDIVNKKTSANIHTIWIKFKFYQIEYFLKFQKYPKTLSTGVASIYNISGWKPDKVKKAFGIANLQYSYRNPRNIQLIKKCHSWKCLILYKTNTQIVNKKSWPVKFYHIVPEDLTECPFIIMISVEIHNYPPPLAVKTPQNIIENLQKIINNEYDLDHTSYKLFT